MNSRHNTSVLLAIPAAMSLGVVLGRPAAAQSIIDTNHSSTVNLSAYATGSMVAITAGTTIAPGTGAAIEGQAGVFWSMTNAGIIDSADDIGISLAGGGNVVNQGAGTIIGSLAAMQLDAGGDIVNSAGGFIGGAGYGILIENAFGSVNNAGVISAGYDGISLNHGGEVVNNGTIIGGHIGVYTGYGAGAVTNNGLIMARTGDAVSLYTGGSLNNLASGRIIGGYSGVYAGGLGSSIQNAGIISGPRFGVYLTGISNVSNVGTIAGGADGIIDVGAGGSLENSGIITGTSIGVRFAANASVVNAGTISGGVTGLKLGAGSTLTNQLGGLIEGGSVGLQAGDNVVIGNAGVILDNSVAGAVLGSGDTLANTGSIGGVTGIIVGGGNTSVLNTGTIVSTLAGGNAIYIGAGGTDFLTLGTGSDIMGDIAGAGSDSQIALTGTGMLDSNITGFGVGSTLNVAPGADWIVSGNWTVASVTNAGVLQPGIISAPLHLTGNFTQLSSGTLRVVVTPGATAQFVVSGAVRLGGNLVYVLAPGNYAAGSEDFLSASGGVTGSFASITDTQTQNGSQALRIVSLANTASLFVPQSFTVAPADVALFAAANQAMAMDAQRNNDTLLDHAANDDVAPCLSAVAGSPGTQAGIAGAFASAFCNAGGWLEATGTAMNVSGSYNTKAAGFLAGIGRTVSRSGTRLGFAVGYDDTSLTDDVGGKADIDTTRIGIYGAQPMGRFMLTGDVIGGFASTATTRQTGAGGAAGRSNATILSGALQIARAIEFGGTMFLPAAGLQIADVNTGAFDESTKLSAFAVQAAASSGNSLRPYVGMAVSRHFTAASLIVLAPMVSIGADYEAEDPGHAVTIVAQDGTAFNARAKRLAPFAGQAAVGIAAGRNNWSVSAHYSAQLAANWSSQTVAAALQIKF